MKNISNPYGLSSAVDEYRVAARTAVSTLAFHSRQDELEVRRVVIDTLRKNIADALLQGRMSVDEDPRGFTRTYTLDGYFLTREQLAELVTLEAQRLARQLYHPLVSVSGNWRPEEAPP